MMLLLLILNKVVMLPRVLLQDISNTNYWTMIFFGSIVSSSLLELSRYK
jgi:hypothetical protein